MNLLQETIDALTVQGKHPSDVKWVGSMDGEYGLMWDDFAKIASVEYDEGYGGQEIAEDLGVVVQWI